VQISDWQLAVAFGFALLALLGGGWLLRERQPLEPHSEAQRDPDPLSKLKSALDSAGTQSREALEAELADAREEAELILLQLHQVQEELEHYFLLSRDLQQQLEQALVPAAQLETLRAIKQRLLDLIVEPGQAQAPDPRLQALVQRQQEALRRFAALHEPPQPAPTRTQVLSSGDELVFL